MHAIYGCTKLQENVHYYHFRDQENLQRNQEVDPGVCHLVVSLIMNASQEEKEEPDQAVPQGLNNKPFDLISTC